MNGQMDGHDAAYSADTAEAATVNSQVQTTNMRKENGHMVTIKTAAGHVAHEVGTVGQQVGSALNSTHLVPVHPLGVLSTATRIGLLGVVLWSFRNKRKP